MASGSSLRGPHARSLPAASGILLSARASGNLSLKAMEHFFVCPYCGERISMVLDTSVKGQTYIEDCEVCCQPVEVRYTVKDDEVRHFEARIM